MRNNLNESNNLNGANNSNNRNKFKKQNRANNRNNLNTFEQFLREEDGMGTVEIILIIVVLIGLVLIFKDRITDIIDDLFKKITTQSSKV